MIDPGELPGPPEPPPPDVVIDVQSPPPGAPQPLVFTSGTEPTVHGLVGTYFGDLEIDHGNSVRWLAFFTDDLFITDVNTGEQRYWVIDWSALFPTSEHTVTGRNFFRDAANWRREQFEYGDKAFHYDDNDWCIFIDGSDGLSFDHRSRPDDYNAEPFMSWIYREVERAMDAGRDYATFPLFIYLHESDLQTITYGINTTPDAVAAGVPAVTKTMAVPWYLPYQGLTRLWKVSALRNPSFDWTKLDTPAPWDIAAGTNIPAVPGYLTPTVGTATTPDPGPLPTQCVFVYKIRGPIIADTGSYHYVASQNEAEGQRSWAVSRHENGNTNFGSYPAGTTAGAVSRVNVAGVPTGADEWRALALNFAAGGGNQTTAALRSLDQGATWTQIVSRTDVAAVPFDSNTVMRIGGSAASGQFEGRIYWVELRSGLDPKAGTVLWRFDASERTGTGTSYVDPRGRTWTLTNASAITPLVPAIPAAPAVKAQIISYAYAHWQPLDIPPGQTEVPPLSPSNDHGYKMRNLISLLRPIPGIPFGPWNSPSADPVGVPGPWGIDVIASIIPALVTTVEEDGHTPPDAATAGVLTPIYTSVVRQNLRDGLWYEQGTYGNVPLAWDDTAEKWVPLYSPDQWPQLGLGSHSLPSPPRSHTSLRLGGGAGDYVSTQNDPFDIRFTFSLAACLALNKWTDGEQNLVSQAQAWAWTLEADGGMTFSRSRNGTAFHDFTIPGEVVPNWDDNETAVIGISYATVVPPDITVKPVDEVRFWLWDGEEWDQLGETQSDPNDDDVEIFNSTAPIQVGGGTPGLFRVVSIRSNVGELNAIGTSEVARMRGDITSNPSYDRYGNTWTNYGTWSNEDMQYMPTLP